MSADVRRWRTEASCRVITELIQNKASEVRTVINTADVTAKEHETSFY